MRVEKNNVTMITVKKNNITYYVKDVIDMTFSIMINCAVSAVIFSVQIVRQI